MTTAASARGGAGEQLTDAVSVRKWVLTRTEVHADGGHAVTRPLHQVVAAAVISNPYASRWSEELDLLMEAGEVLATRLMLSAQEALGGEVEAYGKGGVVGEHGELEHLAAVLHPRFGGPTRELSGGVSILPSVKKRGGIGTPVDIPVHHKTAMLVRSHFDAVELRVPDAPAADELLVALAVTDGGRPHARVGGLRAEEAEGRDGLR
jgi:hypothetical protein